MPVKHTRRAALRMIGTGGAALVIGVHLPLSGGRGRAHAAGQPATGKPFEPNAFIRIGSDNVVTVQIKHIEFGQGPATGLATLVAEELDADWSQMRAELAPANPVYANLLFGIQGTGGSSSIANSFMQMRQAGATARAMLVAAAAKRWHVPASQITVSKGIVRHEGSGKQAPFGELVEDAAAQKPPEKPQLKAPEHWTLIGTELPKLDSADKSRGATKFALDHYPADVVTAVVARPPVFGATPKSVDDKKAKAVPGVLQIATLPKGVAVIASNTYAALKGRDALSIEWDTSGAETRSTEAMFAEYTKAVASKGTEAAAKGSVDATFVPANKVLQAEYLFPFLAHAPMEPLDAVVHVRDDGAEIWMGSQMQTMDHGAFAQVLGLDPAKVALHTLYAGGSFGRRAEPDAGFAVEAALVAKAYAQKKPVKVMWTRTDDIRGGRYRPLTVQRLRGAVDASGAIVGWDQVIASASFVKGTPLEGFMIKNGVDASMVEGARELPYAIPNLRVSAHTMTNGVPGLWWRSVGHTHNGYSTETFIDELLALAGKDPVAGRLALLAEHPRHAGVLKRVAELASWSGSKAANGRARGVAVHSSFGSYVAQIAEISLGEDGLPKVHKVFCAVDCGVAVNPNVIHAQMEGGIGFGLGAALFSEINLEPGGRVREANFDSYRSLRMHEMPEVEVSVIKSAEAPTGVGEPGVPPIAPAVANAYRVLTGTSVRRLPFTRLFGGIAPALRGGATVQGSKS
jgi:isoquinoline 1-oxidoreductase beta subunit